MPLVSDALPGYVSEAALGFFAPKKTPAPIIKQLNAGIQQALKSIDPQVIANNGVEIVGSSKEDFTRFIKADMAKMGEVIKSGSFSN